MRAADLEQYKDWPLVMVHKVADDGNCTCSARTCGSEGKHPVKKTWQEEYSTPDEWTGWREDFNVGVATGEPAGFWVLDLDPDKDGIENFKAALGKRELPATRVHRTGSGGYHYFFAMPEGQEVRNTTDKIAKGVDTRGTGGFVVLPPSVSGKGEYAVVKDGPIVPAPDWLVELVIKKRPVERKTATPEQVSEPTERLTRYAAAAVKGNIERLQTLQETGWEGEAWNNTCFVVACSLIEIGNAPWSGHPLEALELAFFDNAPRDENFGDEQHERIWRSAVERVGDNAREAPPEQVEIGKSARKKDSAVPTQADGGSQPHAGGSPDDFFGKGGGVLSRDLAFGVLDLGPLAVGRDTLFWEYRNGVWRENDHVVENRVIELLQNKYRLAHAGVARSVVRSLVPTISGEPVEDYINFKNGMLEIATGDLKPHDPAYLSTVQLGCAWNPEATCPKFDGFVESTLEPAYARLLWQMIAYLMFSGNPHQTAFLLLGGGSNGKGTVLRVITRLLGRQNVSAVSLDDLGDNRFATADLYGRIANIAGDIDATFQAHTATFKKLVGEDVLRAENKGKPAFDFENWAVPVFSANKIPASGDVTKGYLRRWTILEFGRVFEGDNKIPGLSAMLYAELEGIAAKALTFLPEVLLKGFAQVTEGQERFAMALDQVRQWVEEKTVEAEGAETPRSELYKAYRWWADDMGTGKLKASEFFQRLEDLGFRQKIVRGQRVFVGVVAATNLSPPAFIEQ